MKKFIALLLAVICAFGLFACVPDTGDDEDTIQQVPERVYTGNEKELKVLNYNGGFGEDWIKWAIYRFEEAYKDHVFESEGKVGVKIELDSDKDNYYGTGLYNRMSTVNHDVFFSEAIQYNTWIDAKYMMDITDIVTGTNLDDKTIESKLSTEQQSALKVGGKYYCVPHYAAFTGINYDIDLFDENELYFAKDCAPSEKNYCGQIAYTNLAGERSAGPDGKYDTYDDGLPATYDEFFTLCAYMKSPLGITPFTWTGQNVDSYTNWILAALATDYEGKDQMMLNYNYVGTAKNLAKIENDQIVMDTNDTVITPSNGYEMYRSAGRYYALEFFERLLDNNYDYKDCFGGASQISAQSTYLRSRQDSSIDDIAMLLEGNWWENEATVAKSFSDMSSRYGSRWSRSNRRFGMMPVPKATADKIGEKPTLLDNNYSYAFIRKDISPDNVELAKLFLKFCYTDASLQEFTEIVGVPKALNYTMPEDTKWKSAYSKSLWDLYKSADVVYPISNKDIYVKNQSTFVFYDSFRVDGAAKHAIQELNNGRYSSETYFKGIYNSRNASWWNTTITL